MFKKIICLILLFSLVTGLAGCKARGKNIRDENNSIKEVSLCVDSPPLSASSAVLMTAEGNSVICEKNADCRMAMASTTKIMTALVAAEEGDLDKIVSVSGGAVGVEGSSVYLFEGERLTLTDLLYAMLLESANDAAAAIAIEVGGSIEGFCDMMNQRARELGLRDTNFKNPHGLYHEEHYTTAKELAIITSEALKNDTLREIFATRKHTVTSLDGNTRVLYNHNKMLSSYEGAIGVKTGFTKKSGRCLVSAAERDGLTLICVTLSAPDDWHDHTSLLDLGFASVKSKTIFKIGEFQYPLDLSGANEASVLLTNAEEISLILPASDFDRLRLVAEPYSRFEIAPIKKGDTAGRLSVYLGEEKLMSVPIVFAADAEPQNAKKGLLYRIKNIFF